MAGAGGTQIIGGKSYNMYTPEWYAAQDANKVHQGDVAGQAAGTAAGAASKAQWQTKYPGIQTPGPYDYQNVMSGLSSALSSGSSFGGGGNFSQSPIAQVGSYSAQGGSTPTAHITAPDTTAAENAAFARAKDQVGLTTRGALSGLAGAMAGRGIVGSGVEGRGQRGTVNQGQQQLGDVSRQQAITHADLAQKNAESEYSGAITQRGQDISANEAMNGLNLTARGQDITQRGQDIGLQQANNQLALERQKMAMQQLQSIQAQFNTFRPVY